MICKLFNCSELAKCRGYCLSCYNKQLLEGKFDLSVQKCGVKDCIARIKGRTDSDIPLCNAHYSKWWRDNKKPKDYDKLNYRKKNKEALKTTKNKNRVTVSGRYARGKSHAKRRNILWAISKTDYVNLIKDNVCYYCQGILNIGGASVDRLDSEKPYEINNVVACCWKCNNLKGNYLTVEETKEIVLLLRKMRNKDNIWK